MSSLTFSGQRESTLSLVLRLDPWGPRAPGKFVDTLGMGERSLSFTLPVACIEKMASAICMACGIRHLRAVINSKSWLKFCVVLPLWHTY